jgi:hypothetical protein
MTAQISVIDGQSRRDEPRVAHPSPSAGRMLRYQLDVIASDIADVVRSAGGWLCDRAMAGWDVNVLVADHFDARPLHTLGVRTLPETEFESIEFESIDKRPPTQALAVAADMFSSHAWVRQNVSVALERGRTEVILWGDTRPAELGHRVRLVEHRLSLAARAFKARALEAAGAPPDWAGRTENFRSGVRWCPTVDSDLVPVG